MRQPGKSFFQYLETFAAEFRFQCAHSGDVSTWMCEADDKSRDHRITGAHYNDGDSRSRVLGSESCWKRQGENYIQRELREFDGESRKAVHLSTRIAAFNGDIPTFDIAQLPQAFLERRIRCGWGGSCPCQKTYPGNFCWLLRLC